MHYYYNIPTLVVEGGKLLYIWITILIGMLAITLNII